MSKPNYRPTSAKLWVKHVKEILIAINRPVSTWQLLECFKAKVLSMNLLAPETGNPLSVPDITYLEWMVSRRIINKHKFKNRTHDYWTHGGLNVAYDFMNDDPNNDKEVLPKPKEPYKGKNKGVPGHLTPKGFKKGDISTGFDPNNLEEVPDEFKVTRFQEIIKAMQEDMAELLEKVERQERRIDELETVKGIVKDDKPKTPKKTQKKVVDVASFLIQDLDSSSKLQSIRNYQLRVGLKTGNLPGLKASKDVFEKWLKETGVQIPKGNK